MVDVSPASWDIMKERVWVYKVAVQGLAGLGLVEGMSRAGPAWATGTNSPAGTIGKWWLQSHRQVGCWLGHPVLELESWGYQWGGNTYKKTYEGSGNYAKTSTYNASKYLFGQFVGGEHWSVEVSFSDSAGTIAVPVSSAIPGPISLSPQKLDGPSGTGLFRHEIQTIKGGAGMHRKFYAYHGTYWV